MNLRNAAVVGGCALGLSPVPDFFVRVKGQKLDFSVEHSTELHPLQEPRHPAHAVGHFVLETVIRPRLPPKDAQRSRALLATKGGVASASQLSLLVKHELPKPELQRRLRRRRRSLQEAATVNGFVGNGDERARIRTMLAMNRVVYPDGNYATPKLDHVHSFPGGSYKGSPNAGETVAAFGARVTATHNQWNSDMEAVLQGNANQWAESFTEPSGEPLGLGVSAGVYNDGTTRVIVFRGTETTSDFNNLLHWHEGWFLHRLRARYMQMWQDAGLSITSEMLARAEVDDVVDRAKFLGMSSLIAASDDYNWVTSLGLERADLIQQGYWPLTKAVVRAVLPAGRNTAGEATNSIYITGHSQGGGRAAMASIWLENTDGTAYPTYLFAGVGTQCAVRYSTAPAYSQDIDVTRNYAHIKQYVNVLDGIGYIDFSNAGTICRFGSTDLATHLGSPTKEFCGKTIGVAGSTWTLPSNAESADMYRCRYFVHATPGIQSYLLNDTVLAADGSTDGGCAANTYTVPAGDPNAICPPCRQPRCVRRLPQSAIGWSQRQLNAPTQHPCMASGATTPSIGSMIDVGNPETLSQFVKCFYLGPSSYLMLGSSQESAARLRSLQMTEYVRNKIYFRKLTTTQRDDQTEDASIFSTVFKYKTTLLGTWEYNAETWISRAKMQLSGTLPDMLHVTTITGLPSQLNPANFRSDLESATTFGTAQGMNLIKDVGMVAGSKICFPIPAMPTEMCIVWLNPTESDSVDNPGVRRAVRKLASVTPSQRALSTGAGAGSMYVSVGPQSNSTLTLLPTMGMKVASLSNDGTPTLSVSQVPSVTALSQKVAEASEAPSFAVLEASQTTTTSTTVAPASGGSGTGSADGDDTLVLAVVLAACGLGGALVISLMCYLVRKKSQRGGQAAVGDALESAVPIPANHGHGAETLQKYAVSEASACVEPLPLGLKGTDSATEGMLDAKSECTADEPATLLQGVQAKPVPGS
ncbi:unnamed protein product [Amoebophrya sp. A120]|nr:unnamed protein product [Amoebophrya sp. A120]|eukprot:GSA120T00015343001.1